jgi:hypothetical protein
MVLSHLSSAREAIVVYSPAGRQPCLLGLLRLNKHDALEWSARAEVVVASEDDAEVIAGFGEYVNSGCADIGGPAMLELLTSTFSHTIRIEAA